MKINLCLGRKLGIIYTFLFFIAIFCNVSEAKHVKGYFKKDGTYVEGYERTKKDHSKSNNYSHEGNINPYTEKKGEKKN